MTVNDGYLRSVPTDTNPNDGRLSDPTTADVGTSTVDSSIAWPLAALGAAVLLIAAAASVVLPFNGSGDASAPVTANASAALSFASSGAATAPLTASGSVRLPFNVVGTASFPDLADGSIAIPFISAGQAAFPVSTEDTESIGLRSVGTVSFPDLLDGTSSLPFSSAATASAPLTTTATSGFSIVSAGTMTSPITSDSGAAVPFGSIGDGTLSPLGGYPDLVADAEFGLPLSSTGTAVVVTPLLVRPHIEAAPLSAITANGRAAIPVASSGTARIRSSESMIAGVMRLPFASSGTAEVQALPDLLPAIPSIDVPAVRAAPSIPVATFSDNSVSLGLTSAGKIVVDPIPAPAPPRPTPTPAVVEHQPTPAVVSLAPVPVDGNAVIPFASLGVVTISAPLDPPAGWSLDQDDDDELVYAVAYDLLVGR